MAEEPKKERVLNIITIGDSLVGKTAMIKQYVDG